MADKYLKYDTATGDAIQQEATVTSAGVANAGDVVALDSSGKLDSSIMPVGIAPEVLDAEATEALGAGDYVNIWNDVGVPKIRLADNTNGREAHGFVLSAFTVGATARVYFEGENNAKSSLIAGIRCWLDQAGDVIQTAPVATVGHFAQVLGVAKNATTIATDLEKKLIRF